MLQFYNNNNSFPKYTDNNSEIQFLFGSTIEYNINCSTQCRKLDYTKMPVIRKHHAINKANITKYFHQQSWHSTTVSNLKLGMLVGL